VIGLKDKLIAAIREVPISQTYEEYVEALADRFTAVGVEVKHGHWMEDNKLRNSSKFICSACGELAYYVQHNRDKTWAKKCPYKYCPNCNARMDGEQNGKAE
jgi:ribosomal protein L33